MRISILGSLLLPALAEGACPFATDGTNQQDTALPGHPPFHVQKAYAAALAELDWDNVKSDLKQLFKESKDEWPADYGHYGGLFIRLAWHCSGSYRASDGRGGCDGGNQRFDPERSWEDNTNLDKARSLLKPIKKKYGMGLSWGDLIIYSGTVAIEDMGGPVLGFCGGRMDHVDGSQTILLGPSVEQEKFAPCAKQGDCKYPLGANTMGLIYVNPEGPLGEPNPKAAADTIRDVFGRMGLGDRANVALIGGGHTFGKSHGACPEDPGPAPEEDPVKPWPGNCHNGRGNSTMTSGFEGAWTSNPTNWDNAYFKYLLDHEWEKHIGPGGHYQWRVKGGDGPKAPVAYPPGSDEEQDVMMLTTDIALVADPEYKKYVEEFANDEKAFADAFSSVWYELTARDMGPVSRCAGPDVAPPQPFQHPLPDPPSALADTTAVEKALNKMMDKQKADGEFIHLALKCANTYRITDHLGGCNGARIRFSEWPAHEGLADTLKLLEPVKKKFKNKLSWADLIVLAGNVAVKRAGAPSTLPFCPGRTDATDGKGWDMLAFGNANHPMSVDDMVERYERRGLTAKEFVALSWSSYPSVEHLRNVLDSDGSDDDVMSSGFKYKPELNVWVEYYTAAGDELFANDFAAVWTKLMNADRFDGPVGNVCDFAEVCLPDQAKE